MVQYSKLIHKKPVSVAVSNLVKEFSKYFFVPTLSLSFCLVSRKGLVLLFCNFRQTDIVLMFTAESKVSHQDHGMCDAIL